MTDSRIEIINQAIADSHPHEKPGQVVLAALKDAGIIQMPPEPTPEIVSDINEAIEDMEGGAFIYRLIHSILQQRKQ